MDSTSIYYKNMVDAMTYDGNMIFGHDNRHPSPVSIDIPAKGWWWAKYFKNRDLEDRRFYAHEVHVPDDYMILAKESFTPKKRNFEAGILTDDPEMLDAAIEQFDNVWIGKFCKDCGRREYCSDPI